MTDPSPTPPAESARPLERLRHDTVCVDCGHRFDRHITEPDIEINYLTCADCERCEGFAALSAGDAPQPSEEPAHLVSCAERKPRLRESDVIPRCDCGAVEYRTVDGGPPGAVNPVTVRFKAAAVSPRQAPQQDLDRLQTIANLTNAYHNDGTPLTAAQTLRAIADALGEPFEPRPAPQQEKVCGCGDHTTNTDGRCDTCLMTDRMKRQAALAAKLFVHVPMNDCENLPDPDYGLDSALPAPRPMETPDPEDETRQGCHCWERWYGEWRYAGTVITCPFHGTRIEDMLAGKSPSQIDAARPKLKPSMSED